MPSFLGFFMLVYSLFWILFVQNNIVYLNPNGSEQTKSEPNCQSAMANFSDYQQNKWVSPLVS